MLVTKRAHDRDMAHLEREIKAMHDRHWSLWHKYERLLSHFGLHEHVVKERIELRSKGGPELEDE